MILTKKRVIIIIIKVIIERRIVTNYGTGTPVTGGREPGVGMGGQAADTRFSIFLRWCGCPEAG